MIATFIKVFDPAIWSASVEVAPVAIAAALNLSNQFPITGSISDTENIPAPPISESPNAPDFGTYSATKPSMVGQK